MSSLRKAATESGASSDQGFSFRRRTFLKIATAASILPWTHFALAQTIPVMFWQLGDQSLPSGVISGGPISSGALCGPP